MHPTHPTGSRTRLSRTTGALALAALALGLAGCQSDGLVTGTVYPNDYRLRHPIALANDTTTLDLFVGRNAGGLDPRQARDLRQFLADYQANGRGAMTVLVPRTGGRGDHRGASAVRATLIAYGISGRMLHVVPYDVAVEEPIASPVRLSFVKLQAKVLGECGDFTQDLAGLNIRYENWQNKPHPNSGCAYQTAIAAQIEDPLDLQRPRAVDRPDVLRRMKVFDDIRKGQDPSTQWKTGSASVQSSASGSGGSGGQ
ncbi:CpaD family pilus assembly protein [uncultured Alsobacter sp.]|uniref:CpaD family pilus assembly protein n=1 Tax=uncultured Alsobacter sp. TaxID=1748258 RepID=UPI0025D0296D|nr:CpaD family pilus assembly protein [uncultured Alsobacter sp.]